MFDDKLNWWLWERRVKRWKASGKRWKDVGAFSFGEYLAFALAVSVIAGVVSYMLQ